MSFYCTPCRMMVSDIAAHRRDPMYHPKELSNAYRDPDPEPLPELPVAWVVLTEVDYEGSEPRAVFTNLDDAERWAAGYPARDYEFIRVEGLHLDPPLGRYDPAGASKEGKA